MPAVGMRRFPDARAFLTVTHTASVLQRRPSASPSFACVRVRVQRALLQDEKDMTDETFMARAVKKSTDDAEAEDLGAKVQTKTIEVRCLRASSGDAVRVHATRRNAPSRVAFDRVNPTHLVVIADARWPETRLLEA